ncbi:MAG: sensor histidine kinase [Steroidobacteraceae bacterium]
MGSVTAVAAMGDEVQQAIARAKQDWESTADTLPHVICLLDERRRAVRVNRAIESWQLGRVQDVMGCDMHALLHPQGCEDGCGLGALLQDAWARTLRGACIEFEAFDSRLDRFVSVAVRPINGDRAARRAAGHARAVMVVSDVTPLHVARTELEGLNQGLEVRVLARTRELENANRDLQNEIEGRAAAEQALRESRNELGLLSQQLIKAQESERGRIAQELHDSVGQSLAAIKYSLERAAELDRQGRRADTRSLLTRTIERVQETIAEIRAIAMDLRPPVLDDLGVASALAWLCREFADTYPHIRIRNRISAADSAIPPRLATVIFRCAQELFNNVAKHAQAKHLTVALSREPATVTLIVADDGVGLPTADSSGSFRLGHGIRNLRERTQMTAGKLALSAGEGGGTRVRVDWTLLPDELPPAGGDGHLK